MGKRLERLPRPGKKIREKVPWMEMLDFMPKRTASPEPKGREALEIGIRSHQDRKDYVKNVSFLNGKSSYVYECCYYKKGNSILSVRADR